MRDIQRTHADLGTCGNRRTKISGTFCLSPRLAPPTTSISSNTNIEQARIGRDGKHQSCSFHMLTTHSDVDCQIQHRNKTNGGSTYCTTHSYYPAVLSACDHPSNCDSERPCISFTATEAPTEEEKFWPFGLTDEPVASFIYSSFGHVSADTNKLFGAFGGVTSEETGSAAIMVRKGQSGGWGFETASPAVWRSWPVLWKCWP